MQLVCTCLSISVCSFHYLMSISAALRKWCHRGGQMMYSLARPPDQWKLQCAAQYHVWLPGNLVNKAKSDS